MRNRRFLLKNIARPHAPGYFKVMTCFPSSKQPSYHLESVDPSAFSLPLLAWFDSYGRKDLPWQHPRNAYRVWISEIMLQQTQVKTVIPYFNRFLIRFPDIQSLALASLDEVLAHWSGLGYYSRARHLHKTAAIIYKDFKEDFPRDVNELAKLPGIGPSTAAAITSLAFGQSTAILDGNVKRVLCRYFLIAGFPGQSAIHKKLWALAQACMPKERSADYTQAIMDLGATCCTLKNPTCGICPLQSTCLAKKHNKTADYPYKKPKKIIPIRQQQFLLLYTAENTIYLEKRPPTGIWGGLWCLPSIEDDACPIAYLDKNNLLSEGEPKELLKIHHSFSHFHLHIKAVAIQVKPSLYQNLKAMELVSRTHTPIISESAGAWFLPKDTASLGMSKPMKDILAHFLSINNA